PEPPTVNFSPKAKMIPWNFLLGHLLGRPSILRALYAMMMPEHGILSFLRVMSSRKTVACDSNCLGKFRTVSAFAHPPQSATRDDAHGAVQCLPQEFFSRCSFMQSVTFLSS